MAYTVRTLFLQNYFAPAQELAQQRRKTTDMQALVGAMKRTELADKTLEKELNAFVEKGFRIVSVLQHPDTKHPEDLLVTVILES